MDRLLRWMILIVCVLSVPGGVPASDSPPATGQRKEPTRADAERMIQAAEGSLSPVYAPLAEEIAERLNLSDKQGVGIDLGSGPGTLILELCKHTKLHWIDADINPYFFPYFFGRAEAGGFGGRVSAIRADACALPFRDEFADGIVSRGSFQFWPDLQKGLSEIHRVLKRGGAAYIGRGLAERMPLDIAKKVREGRGEGPKYDPNETEQQLRKIMTALGIEDFRIYRPKLNNSEGVNYGVWLQFRKAM